MLENLSLFVKLLLPWVYLNGMFHIVSFSEHLLISVNVIVFLIVFDGGFMWKIICQRFHTHCFGILGILILVAFVERDVLE